MALRTSSRARRAPLRADEVVSLALRARSPDGTDLSNLEIPPASPADPAIANNVADFLEAREGVVEIPQDQVHTVERSDAGEPMLRYDRDDGDQDTMPALVTPDDSSGEEDYDAIAERYRTEYRAAQIPRVTRPPANRAPSVERAQIGRQITFNFFLAQG